MAAQAFALLCALGVVTFISSLTRTTQIFYVLAGVACGVVLLDPAWLLLPWKPLLSVDAAQVSLLLFMLAFARVGNLLPASVFLPVAGILAVVWLQALGSLGYPPLLALPVVLVASVAALLGSLYVPEFRNAALLEEAFLIVMLYALALAIVPEVISGWDAAVGLKSAGAAEKLSVQNDHHVLWLAAGFAVLGAAYAKWQQVRKVSVKRKT